ncbi:hypothetical protein J2W51_002300 [Tardiphaga robiniae]|uniref:hypothetical protein n=1 Tax=Tardiphaga robiniae TaxID=943830 RepID=UPI0028661A64|nr:hypothetical protein [Tardiphaga robiniae]MDR6659730.1 hypothetical protein [Tardiphaga robiniae]
MRQLSREQIDAVVDAVHAARMIAEVVGDVSQELWRPTPEANWELKPKSGELLAHFSFEQVKALDHLTAILKEAGVVA